MEYNERLVARSVSDKWFQARGSDKGFKSLVIHLT